MDSFNGVATKNLDAYLGWHRYLDTGKKVSARRFLEVAIGLRK